MPTISKKEYEEYKSLCYDRDHGRILTPDGLATFITVVFCTHIQVSLTLRRFVYVQPISS